MDSIGARRLRMTLAYDGTEYHGFQRQDNAITVQQLLEAALGRVAGHEVTVTPAGRTDAGVHASGQVVHWDLHGTIPTDRVARAVNGLLPGDIVVYRAEEVAPDFHARYHAVSKTYQYSILLNEFDWPFISRYVYHYTGNLDLQAMKFAAGLIQGKKDFASFQASGGRVQSTVRNLMSIKMLQQKMEWGTVAHFIFQGDGFLQHMIRNIMGTLIEVGRGHKPLAWVEQVLEARDRRAAGPTAPAGGLTLMEVKYDA